MDQKQYLEWQSKIVLLTNEQVTDLRQRLNQLKGKQDKESVPDDWLLQALLAQMKKRGLISSVSYQGLLKGTSYKIYSSFSKVLRADLEKLLPPRINQAQGRMALGQLVANALIEWHQDRDLLITPGMILKNANKAVEALNECFPGYVACNMLHVAIDGLDAKV